MRLTIGWLVGALVMMCGVVDASGQIRPAPRKPRPPLQVWVAINGGYATAAGDFRDGTTFRANGETGRFDADYNVKAAPALDVSGDVRVWPHLSLGVGVSRVSRSTPAAVSGSIPHPFFFNRPRSVGGEATGLTQDERAVHVRARGTFPVGRTVASVFGGPSFIHVRQDVIRELGYSEQYPYDEATFGPDASARADASTVGLHVGGDVAYFFTPRLGVGFGAMVTAASVDVSSASGGALRLGVGGVQAGGGLRLRF